LSTVMVRGFATFLTQGDRTERYPREDHDRRERRQHGSDLVDWTGIARLTRAATLALHERDYVRSACASGGRATYNTAAHILPNVPTPLIVAVTLTIGRVILIEPVRASWGSASGRPRQAGATRRNWRPRRQRWRSPRAADLHRRQFFSATACSMHSIRVSNSDRMRRAAADHCKPPLKRALQSARKGLLPCKVDG
jgi:hypothetical protein